VATEVMKEVVLLGCRAFCRSTRSQLSASERGENGGVTPIAAFALAVEHTRCTSLQVSISAALKSSVITASFAENR